MNLKSIDRIRTSVNSSERDIPRRFSRYLPPADTTDGWQLCRLDSGSGKVRKGRIQKRDETDWVDDETIDLVNVYMPVAFIKDEELVAVTKMGEDIYYPTRLTRMKSYSLSSVNGSNNQQSITAQELLENPNFSATYFGKDYVETHNTTPFNYPVRELAQSFNVSLDTLVYATGNVAVGYDTARSVVIEPYFITDEYLPFGDSHLVSAQKVGSDVQWTVKDRRVTTSQTVWIGTETVTIIDPATNNIVELTSSQFPIDGTLHVSVWYTDRDSSLRHEITDSSDERYVTDQISMQRSVNRFFASQTFGGERSAGDKTHRGIAVLGYANGF